MGLFNKQAQNVVLSEKEKLLKRYNGACMNILLVVIFSAVNVGLLIFGSDSYFLFSASIPYYLPMFGMLYTGKYPAEFYDESWAGFEFFGEGFYTATIVIAAVIIALYLLCFFLSKKKGYGWLIVAIILFALDTAAMFYLVGFSSESIIDILFHGWVIVSLASGISAGKKLKNISDEEAFFGAANPAYQYNPQMGYPENPQQEIPYVNNNAAPNEDTSPEAVQKNIEQ